MTRTVAAPVSAGKKVLLGAVMTAGALLVYLSFAEGSATERSFTLSADPSQVVMSLEYVGGLAVFNTRYRLYGDGRITMEKVSVGGPRAVLGSEERHLSPEEVDELIRPVVEGGLFDLSVEEIDTTYSRNRKLYPPSDNPSSWLSVAVESYTHSDAVESGPLTRELIVSAPAPSPEISIRDPILAALGQLQQRLRDLFFPRRVTQ